MQLTLHATRRTRPHGASRLVLAMSAWSVKTRRAPSRHRTDARVYGRTTTAMHDNQYNPPADGALRKAAGGQKKTPFGFILRTSSMTKPKHAFPHKENPNSRIVDTAANNRNTCQVALSTSQLTALDANRGRAPGGKKGLPKDARTLSWIRAWV